MIHLPYSDPNLEIYNRADALILRYSLLTLKIVSVSVVLSPSYGELFTTIHLNIENFSRNLDPGEL